MTKISQSANHRSDHQDLKIQEVSEIYFDALNLLCARVVHLAEISGIQLRDPRENPNDILFRTGISVTEISKIVTSEEILLLEKTSGVNAENLILLRDHSIYFCDRLCLLSEILAGNKSPELGWIYLNMGSYHIAKAEMVTFIDLRIKEKILKKQTRKSKEASNQITNNAKESLAELFKNNAPALGWKTLKVALHEIRKHLRKELKAKKPTSDQQEIEEALEDLLLKLVNWMRTDLNFKSLIDRHIQKKTVPDLAHLE